jgi:hypothetical protein
LSNPVPSLSAILICEKVIEEVGTRKKTLVGIFDNVQAQALPIGLPLGIYARLADGEGEYSLLVRISTTDADGNEIRVFEGTMQGSVPSRLQAFEIAINFLYLQFDRPGRYDIQIHADGVYVGHASFNVSVAPQQEGL